ncbi:hypothetical protein JCM10450v2_005181 [Rhodotorula kratochvilovae]
MSNALQSHVPAPQPFRPTHHTLPAGADPLDLLSAAADAPPSLLNRHDSQRASPPPTVHEGPSAAPVGADGEGEVRDWGRGRVGEDGLVYGGEGAQGRERGGVVEDSTFPLPAQDKALDPSLHREAPPQAQLHGREFGSLGTGRE